MLYYFLLLYFALPALFANMIPVIVAKIDLWPALNKPMDFEKTLFGKRILGPHKTIRGLISGTIVGGAISTIQYLLERGEIIKMPFLESYSDFLIYGLLAGFGALLGDAFFSFIKRQINIPSGRPFIPFDQIDYILGFIGCTLVVVPWKWPEIIFLCVVALVLNPLTNLIGYLFHIKKTYW